MPRRLALTALAVLAAGCASPAASSPRTDPGPPPVPVPREHLGLAVLGGPIGIAPGETLPLPRPVLIRMHGSVDPLPATARITWAVVGGGATVDGVAGTLTVPTDAAPGSTIEARVTAGEWTTTVPVVVVDPAPNPIAGQWTQVGATVCGEGRTTGKVARELVFQRVGSFSVTEFPFESYHDYWGSYRYDAATGRLSLAVERGNALPGFRTVELRAAIDTAGQLVLHGAPLLRGEAETAEPPCRSVYRRPGAAAR